MTECCYQKGMCFLSHVLTTCMINFEESVTSPLEEDTGRSLLVQSQSRRQRLLLMKACSSLMSFPFGFSIAPATFQRLMQKILSGLGSFCNVYIDDILIFLRKFDEHRLHLQEVFGQLERYSLKLHPQKCQLALPEVEYLGHIVLAEGVHPNTIKIDAVRKFPMSICVRAVREFIGLCSYYRKFVLGFATIASPINQLLCKNVPFKWTEACHKAFQLLKELLT